MESFLNLLPTFLLIFVRVVSYFVIVPIFSYRTLPAPMKIGLAFFLALAIYPTIEVAPIETSGVFLLLVIKETLVGLAIGLMGFIMISAIQVTGGFIDFQLGLAMANVFDPQTGAQTPIMGQYVYMFALLFLLATNGHHLLLDAIYHSYQFIPMNTDYLAFGDENTITMIAKAFGAMFAIAFQMSAPIVGSIFLVDIALGIVARTVPQLNIFVVGFPVKILVGFILIFIIISTMLYTVGNLFELVLYAMRDLMRLLGS